MAHSKKEYFFNTKEEGEEFVVKTKAARLPDEEIYTSGPFPRDQVWVVTVEIYWG